MKLAERIKAGDFTQLASMYNKYRPGYSEAVLRAFLGIINRPINEIDFVDVGAGTGIWTRLFAKQGCRTATAIEPNAEMRAQGASSNGDLEITWLEGSAEKTPLPNQCADFVSMASSFHWANFETATQEFHRLLKPQGHFAILWNPRHIEENSVLQEIENYITQLAPDIKRVSSGKSTFVNELADRLGHCQLFEDIVHIEGFHTVQLTHEEYIGVWNSVNDIRSQLGEQNFQKLMSFIKDRIKSLPVIDCTYQTRAWIVRKK